MAQQEKCDTSEYKTLSQSMTFTMLADYVSQGRTVVLPLRGVSMRPYLEDNRDKALLAAVPKVLRRGDVVLARLTANGGFALHRIIRIDGDTIVMCGDGNFTSEVVKRQDILAIARGFYRDGSERLESVDTISYRMYWRSWLLLRPLRRWMLLVWRMCHYPRRTLGEIKRKIKKQK